MSPSTNTSRQRQPLRRSRTADATSASPAPENALLRTPGLTLTEQLAERMAQRIRDHLLSPGMRLPSVRQCAQQQQVSTSTVVAAYDLLVAQGLVESRRNRGFFVREHQNAVRQASTRRQASRSDAAGKIYPVNATTLIRAMFSEGHGRPQAGAGLLPAEWLQAPFLESSLRRTSTRSASPLQRSVVQGLDYGSPQGSLALRQALSRRLAYIGIDAPDSQIITSMGATQALDIVSRALLRPGDAVMVEAPGWSLEFARLHALGMRVLPVPRGPAGPDLEVMERYCKAHAPRLFFSVSVLHNPTGYSLTPTSAHQILQLAARHDFHVVEDDVYSHIAPEHATRLSMLDGLQRTIYVGGFAKILAPGWRIGFMALPAALVDPVLDTKLLSGLTTPGLLEEALAHCIEQGQLRRHTERIRERLAAARTRSVRLARQAGCRFVCDPAGMFGWVDTGVDTEVLAQRLLDLGDLIAPGALFYPTRQASTFMRINFATTAAPAFWRRLAQERDKLLTAA